MTLPLISSKVNAQGLSAYQKEQWLNEVWQDELRQVGANKSKLKKKISTKSDKVSKDYLQGKATSVGGKHDISMAFIEMPLDKVMKIIADSLQLNLIMMPDVEIKNINYKGKQLGMEEVLKQILEPLNYSYRIENGQLTILAHQTRIFTLMLPALKQSFEDTISNESFVRGEKNDSEANSNHMDMSVGAKVFVRTQHKNMSTYKDIVTNVKALLSTNGRLSIDQQAGTLMVTDKPQNIREVTRYMEIQQSRISQQIEVDVKVVEVILSHEHRMGVDWQAMAGRLSKDNLIAMSSTMTAGVAQGGNIFTLSGQGKGQQGSVGAVIQALNGSGQVDVLSQPKIVMLNNQVSVIQVGKTQAYIDQSSIETTQSGGTINSISTAQVQEGVTMRLLGNIVGEDIYLSVTPIITSIDEIRTVKSGSTTIEAPQLTTKSLNTSVKVRNGETIAIGGLMTNSQQDNEQGVPLLSRIPILGKAFSFKHKSLKKAELIIFITPRKI